MTFDPNIPQATDLISASQSDILVNFQQLDAIFGTNAGADHYAWSATTNAGLHKQVDIPVVRSADPTLSAANTGMFYTKTVAGSAQPFFAGWNGSTTVVSPLGGQGSTPIFVPGTNGYSIFPGGMMLQWGTFVRSGTPTLTNVPFNVNFQGNAFMVQCTPHSGSAISSPLSIAGINNTRFQVLTSSSTIDQFIWFAIGLAP